MALYSANELKQKLSPGRRDMREFEPKENKLYHLWIPKEAFFYIKKHFNIKTTPCAKNCRIKAITCINTNPDAEKRKCPICDHIDSLWETWRETKSKEERKKIQNAINRLSSEYIYVNAIDINDTDLKFEALRLTKSMMESLIIAIQDTPIENIIWQYKKKKTNGKVEYTFLESPNDPKAIELCAEYDHLAERPFKDGGLVDLDAALTFETTEKKYLALLAGDGDDSDDSDDDSDDKPATRTRTTKKADVVVDDEDISLDDIEIDDEPAKTKVTKTSSKKDEVEVSLDEDEITLDDDFGLDEEEIKPETPKTTKADKAKATAKTTTKETEISLDDDLELDDLEIDDLDIDDLDVEEEMINVDAKSLNENKKDKAYVHATINVLVDDKKIKRTDDYVTNLKAAFSYLKKSNSTIKVPKAAIDVPF